MHCKLSKSSPKCHLERQTVSVGQFGTCIESHEKTW